MTTVTPYPNGPLILRGDFVIVDPDGTRVDPGRRTVALCRCGRSALKPFCDGSHARVGFHAGQSVHRAGTGWRAADLGEPGTDPCAGAGGDPEAATAVAEATARPGADR